MLKIGAETITRSITEGSRTRSRGCMRHYNIEAVFKRALFITRCGRPFSSYGF